jgi:hypothetical protein
VKEFKVENCYAYLWIQKIRQPQYNLLNSFSRTSM